MSAPNTEAPSAHRLAMRSLVVLVILNIINFYDRIVPGALAEPIRKEFHLTDAQLGFVGTAFTLLYAVVGLPLGRMADRFSRRKLLAAGVAVWGALTALSGWAMSFPVLIASRLGVGVGEAVCAPAATSWIGDLFPPARRARPLALFMLGVPVGGALSSLFSGPLAQRFGWRAAMIAAAAPALLIVPVLLMLKEPERGASEFEIKKQDLASEPLKDASPNFLRAMLTLLRIRTLWWIIASGALVNFCLYAISAFLPAFFSRIHKIDVAHAGYTMAVVYGIGGVLGGLAAGFLGDAIARRANSRLLAAAVAALAAAPLAYFGVQQKLGAMALALPLLTLAYGALNMYYGLVYASIQDLVAPALRGSVMALYFLVMYLGGASFGPLLTGQLSDRMARRAALAAGSPQITEAFKAVGLQQAMLIIPVLSVALAVVLWAGSRTIARDVERNRASS